MFHIPAERSGNCDHGRDRYFLLVLGYLSGVRGKISLVHSRHRNRVSERDKPAFCRLVGFGNGLIGLGLLSMPVLTGLLGESAALPVMVGCILLGGVVVLSAIYKYNA